MKRLTQKEFINLLQTKHGDKYNYKEVIYVNNRTKVKIICNKHGDFEILANSLLSGQGCRLCGKIQSAKNRALTKEYFISKANKIHNNFYNYHNSEYKNSGTKVVIGCSIHGNFTQLPSNHLSGQRCPTCAKDTRHGFKKDSYVKHCERKGLDVSLYLIKLFSDNECFLKVGITQDTINKRIGNIPYEYVVINLLRGSASFIWDFELEIHKKMKNERHIPLKYFKGHTECYSLNNLKQINDIFKKGIQCSLII